MRDPKGEARLIVESMAAAGRAATDVFTGATPPEVERLRARVKVLTTEGGALDHTVWALEDEREETLRRVRVALGDLGVADCDDPLVALEALAADVPRREREATEEHSAAVLRAHAEGRIAGLREAQEIARKVQADQTVGIGDWSVTDETAGRMNDRADGAELVVDGIGWALKKLTNAEVTRG